MYSLIHLTTTSLTHSSSTQRPLRDTRAATIPKAVPKLRRYWIAVSFCMAGLLALLPPGPVLASQTPLGLDISVNTGPIAVCAVRAGSVPIAQAAKPASNVAIIAIFTVSSPSFCCIESMLNPGFSRPGVNPTRLSPIYSIAAGALVPAVGHPDEQTDTAIL